VKKLLLNSLLTFTHFILFAQPGNIQQNGESAKIKGATRLEDSLHQNLNAATNPVDRVKWQGELAQYYIGIDNKRSDDFGKKMLETAESSRDRKLIILSMLKRAGQSYDNQNSQAFIKKGTEFAQNALDIARNSNLEEQMAWSYLYLSRGARANGEIEKGLSYSNHALSLSMSLKSDSLKVLAYNSVGNSYLYKKEKLLAYRNYLAALDLAEQTGEYDLIKNCYQKMIDFNRSLENWDRAKDYQFRLDSMARSNNKYYDVLYGYNSMGGLYAGSKQYDFARMYYDKAIALSDTLDFRIFKLNSYLSIVNLYLMSNQYKEALAYFEEKKELRDFLNTAGMGYLLDQGYGSLYTYVGKYDSAAYYFKKAEPYFEINGTKPYKFFFYSTYSDYFKKIGNFKQAIHYWEKAETIGKQINSFDMIIMAAANLDSLNTMTGDYQRAYQYKSLHDKYKDSVDNLTKEKDLLMAEVDSEKQRLEKIQAARAEETRRRHNLQYMGITAAIASIFILLVMAGAFRVSAQTIKIIGFFAFIFLFEFIILLADNQIHHLTHGEPWMVLAIKIVLIAMLLPLHHWLEEKAVHYLTSKSVLKFSRNNLFGRAYKKTVTVPVENFKDIN
jgi:tetratricopeptide (TPR) repeat protein/uncharacterized membrane protein